MEAIDLIDSLQENEFAKTKDLRYCRYCPYRSYCERGVEAGSIEEHEDQEFDQESMFLGDLDDYDAIAF